MVPVEVSLVRKSLLAARERTRARAQQRREYMAEAEAGYRSFLETTATPIARQLAQALKAEGYPFTVFAPSDGLRLSSDHGRDDYIELSLDTSAELPQVVGRVSRVRGSRTMTAERALKPGAPPSEITEAEVLAYFVEALEPWLER